MCRISLWNAGNISILVHQQSDQKHKAINRLILKNKLKKESVQTYVLVMEQREGRMVKDERENEESHPLSVSMSAALLLFILSLIYRRLLAFTPI